MTEPFSNDNTPCSASSEQLLDDLHKKHSSLIDEEAKKIALEMVKKGGGVIEYKMPKLLLNHIIRKESGQEDKNALHLLFREQVEQRAFDLLIHNKELLYDW